MEPFEQQREEFPEFEPSQTYEPQNAWEPEETKRMIKNSAVKLRCQRFVDWLINSGVLDEIIKRAQNCTLFAPIDSASSQLPYNMLTTMNQRPRKMAPLMRLHAVPKPFESIYPSNGGRPFTPTPINTFSNEQLRFDRSLLPLPNNNNKYQPLVSGCPMLDSHQIGPIRMVSTGSVLFPPQQSVYSVLKRSPNLSLCKEIVDQAQMGPELQRPDRSYTMFTPSNQAMQKYYSPRQMNSMLRDRNQCRQFVQRHLVPRAVYRNSLPLSRQQQVDSNFEGRQCQINNLASEPLRIRRTAQSFYVNDGHVQFADVTTNNGVVHVLNEYI